MSVTVRPIAGPARRAELKGFIELPYRLHSNDPLWVPPLRLERRIFLNKRLNAYFKHGEAEYFLAWKDGRVAGRITAQIDHAFNDYHQNAWGMFGFLEFEDDQEVLDALLEAAGGWLKARGRDRMVGPMDFSMNEECGILVDGFEHPPIIKMPWTPPYYAARCEQAGLQKAMDLFGWRLDISDRSKVLPILPELAAKVEPDHGITIRRMSRLHLRAEMDRFAEVYNAAWSTNWGFVPYSKTDLDAYAQELQLAFDKDWMMVAETKDGKTVGVAMTFPDLNQVLKQMNGRLLPLGWYYFLTKRRRMDHVRIGFLGIKPEYQHTGVAAALYMAHYAVAGSTPRTWGEASWILETNTGMNRGLEAMHGTKYKTHRIYERVF